MKRNTCKFLLLTSLIFLCAGCKENEEPKNEESVVPEIDLVDSVIRDFINATDSSEEYNILKNNGNTLTLQQSLTIDIPKRTSNPMVMYDEDPEFSNPFFYFPDYGDNTVAIPGKTYYYKVYSLKGDDEERLHTYDIDLLKTMPQESVLVKEGKFTTKDGLRPCDIYGKENIRDIGGWKTVDGKTVKYGKLFRGPEVESLTRIGEITMKGQLGIKTEIDLREGSTQSFSSFADNFVNAGIDQYDGINPSKIGFHSYNTKHIKDIFSLLSNESNYPMYYHCAVGCDRTGTLSFLLNGVLGVSNADLTKDFELSTFSCYGPRYRGPFKQPYVYGKSQDDSSNYVNWGALISLIRNIDTTDTLPWKDRFKKFLMESYAIPEAQIEAFRSIMLGD